MSESQVRVLVVDDSQVVRRGIRVLLESSPDLKVVGEAGDGAEAQRLAAEHTPDVILLDVQMPGTDGLSVVASLAADARVLMLTFSDTPEVVKAALDGGATGYIVHGTFDAETLAATVRSVADGLSVFSGPALEVVRGVPPVAQSVGVKSKKWGISERQADVLGLMSEGKTNRQIAQELFLTEKTVKNHINQIFAKLGVSSRGEAIARWLGTAAPDVPSR